MLVFTCLMERIVWTEWPWKGKNITDMNVINMMLHNYRP